MPCSGSIPPHGPLHLTERRSPLTKCRQSPSADSPQGRREERRVGTGACPRCLLDMSARWSGRLAAFRTIDQTSDASCPAKGGERSSVPVHLPISAPEVGVCKELTFLSDLEAERATARQDRRLRCGRVSAGGGNTAGVPQGADARLSRQVGVGGLRMICRPATGHPNARTHRQQTPAGRRSAMSGPVTKPLNRSNARVRNVPSRGRAMAIRHAVGPVFLCPVRRSRRAPYRP